MAAQILKIQNAITPNRDVFEVERVAAEHSAVIRTLLEDFDEDQLNDAIIPISVDISDECLAKVFGWVIRCKDEPKLVDSDKLAVFTDWDRAFFDAIESHMLFEILVATNYLEISPLYEMGCQIVADMIRGKTTEEIRGILNIKNDFTPEEEEAIRKENAWAYVQHGNEFE
jgi:S-phase kinase-associated protein 1